MLYNLLIRERKSLLEMTQKVCYSTNKYCVSVCKLFVNLGKIQQENLMRKAQFADQAYRISSKV